MNIPSERVLLDKTPVGQYDPARNIDIVFQNITYTIQVESK